MFKGVIASGDQFIASEDYVTFLQDWFNAIACEMEGASVAAVCEKYNVPFVVIRSMSDKADGKAHESIQNMGDIAADHSGRIVMKMLENLSEEKKELVSEKEKDPVPAAYADHLFKEDSVHQIDLVFDENHPAAAETVIDGESFKDIAVLTEEESAGRSYTLRFDQARQDGSYYGLPALHLSSLTEDPTCMKHAVACDLFEKAGIKTPLFSYVLLTVNGTDPGLYLAEEPFGEAYLCRIQNEGGEIYCVKPEENESGEIHGADLVFTTANPYDYPDIIEHAVTPAKSRDHHQVIASLASLSRIDRIDNYFDADALLSWFAVHNFLLDYDSYTGRSLNHLVLLEKDGKLSVLPGNYSRAFIMTDANDVTAFLNTGIDTPLNGVSEESRPLWSFIPHNPTFSEAYHADLERLVKEDILSGAADEKIDRIYEMIRPYTEKQGRSEEFRTSCENLKVVLRLRAESIEKQLAGTLSSDTSLQKEADRVKASSVHIPELAAEE